MNRSIAEKCVVAVHVFLILWAVVFVGSLFLADGGKAASILAFGNFAFLFLDIPFSAVSLVLKKKGFFRNDLSIWLPVLAGLNTVIGAAAWFFVLQLLFMP